MTQAQSQPLSIEQKILLAATQSEQVVAIFSPVAAQLVAAGVEVEPIFSGFVMMIKALFVHHVTPAPAPVAPAPAPATPAPAGPTAAIAPAAPVPLASEKPADGSNVPIPEP